MTRAKLKNPPKLQMFQPWPTRAAELRWLINAHRRMYCVNYDYGHMNDVRRLEDELLGLYTKGERA